MTIIAKPIITEKSLAQAEKSVYTFAVHDTATKPEIAKAIEALYKVKVAKVRVAAVKGQVVRRRNGIGKQRDWKKAVITLTAGQSIKDFEFEAETVETEAKETKAAKAK
jgi:large subunit ribosomal protein L23